MTTEKALGFPVPFPGATSSAVRAAVFDKWGWCCAYCGDKAEEIDHFIPIILYGAHAPRNFVAACHACNRDKRSSEPYRWCESKGIDPSVISAVALRPLRRSMRTTRTPIAKPVAGRQTTYLRPSTRRDIDLIAQVRRWTIAQAAESCVREYIDRHGIERPNPAQAAAGREASN